MSAHVPASHVLLDASASTVNEVLAFLSEQAVALGLADDAEAVLEAFKAREAEGTTGMTGGFAIPHAKAEAIKRSGIIVATLTEGVTWDSMDNVPITCAIALLTPAAEAGTTHLALLSKVALALMDEGFRARLHAADAPEDIAAILSEKLADE